MTFTNLRVLEKAAPDEEGIGHKYPIFTQFTLEQSMMAAFDAMLTGKPYPIKALIILGADAILTWPNTNKVKEAFKNLDFIMDIDVMENETAKLSHLVLPAATPLEKWESS